MDELCEIESLQELEQKLQALTPKLAREAVVDAISQAGMIIKRQMEELAPVGPSTDPHQGALEGSIEMLVAIETFESGVIATIGPDARAFWGYFSEYGTCKEPARPWARPAFDLSKQQALDKFLAVLTERIEAVG
jgi:HK97 gp10 family phage protein